MQDIIKQINRIDKKQLIPIVILSFFALLIWYIGPLIVIANTAPLSQPDKRLYAILGICLTWFLIVNFFENKTRINSTLLLGFNNPELIKKCHLLETRFQSAIHFLKNNFTTHHPKEMNLFHLPWYLLIGMPHSGKTTLLANADIHYVLARKFKHDNIRTIPATEVCDWWVTRDVVLVDVPGTYINSRLKNPANADDQPIHKISPHNVLWNNLLGLLKKYRGKQAIDGVIIALPLPELIAQQHHGKERILLELKQRSAELRKTFGSHVPFYIMITKCDLLPGFLEFFGDIGADELSQAWGITMPTTYEKQHFTDIFVKRFNTLIKRLNKQLIWRLHQERNPAIRPQIKDFPLHVERLKDSILSALNTFEIAETNLQVQGIYLSSGIQYPAETRTTNTYEASQALQTAHLIQQPITQPHKTFFIRQLLLKGLAITSPHAYPTLAFRWKDRPFLYSLFASIIFLTAGFIGDQLYQHIQESHAIDSALLHYQASAKHLDSPSSQLINALPLLQALQHAANHYSFLSLSPSYHSQAVAAYHQALQKMVLPEIKKEFANYLTKTNNKNPQALYAGLTAYLMLGNEDRYSADAVFATLKQISPALFTNKKNTELTQLIQAALSTPAWQAQSLNFDFITHARQKLLDLMPVDICYAILKNYSHDSVQSMRTDVSNNGDNLYRLATSQVPSMFTATAFDKIYNQQIPAAVSELITSNWVLGTSDLALDTAALTAQLRARYVNNYIAVWESILSSIITTPPQNLVDADAHIADIISSNSSLLNVLHTIQNNTAAAPIIAASPKLAEINMLFGTNTIQPNDKLVKIQLALNQLHSDLQHILRASNPAEAAFTAAATRMHNPASQDSINLLLALANDSPAPLNIVLNNLALSSWHYVLQDAGQFIQQQWQADVIPTYNTDLANRFPFATNTTDEVTLAQFIKFLGTQGTLTNFFKTYLQPFADNSNKVWVWKVLNNAHIPFSELALNQLQHAANLQRAFFPNGDNQLLVRFTIQPTGLASNTKGLQLNIDGQSIEYDRSTPPIAQTITWPNANGAHTTILNLTTDDNLALNNASNSEWGWFKLVNQFTQKIVTPKELVLSFELSDHKATCLLFSSGSMNPFLPMNLQNFRLPQQLIG